MLKKHRIRSLVIRKVLDFGSKQLKGIGFLRNMFKKFRIFTKKLRKVSVLDSKHAKSI